MLAEPRTNSTGSSLNGMTCTSVTPSPAYRAISSTNGPGGRGVGSSGPAYRIVLRMWPKSVPSRSQCSREDVELGLDAVRARAAAPANRLHASAYRATSRSVFFSPQPPIMIGGCGRVSGCGELSVSASAVVLPVERPVVVAPHLVHDLQRLLEPLEPLRQRRERHAERQVLALVPGGADAEHGPAAGQHVERGDDLGEQARVPVGDAGDEQLQLDGATCCAARKPSVV